MQGGLGRWDVGLGAKKKRADWVWVRVIGPAMMWVRGFWDWTQSELKIKTKIRKLIFKIEIQNQNSNFKKIKKSKSKIRVCKLTRHIVKRHNKNPINKITN